MLLAQEFKSFSGAQKRARFENAHSDTHHYDVVRCKDGQRDVTVYEPDRHDRYTWRIEKTRKV